MAVRRQAHAQHQSFCGRTLVDHQPLPTAGAVPLLVFVLPRREVQGARAKEYCRGDYRSSMPIFS